jgi:ATP/ADP translocase
MAKTIVKKKVTHAHSTKRAFSSPFSIYWDKKNYIFLFLGFALLILGYFVMSRGNWDSTASLVVSPIILFVAYFLIFPASIFYRKKEVKEAVNIPEKNIQA